MVAEWANESIQIQVGLLRKFQVRIPLRTLLAILLGEVIVDTFLWHNLSGCQQFPDEMGQMYWFRVA